MKQIACAVVALMLVAAAAFAQSSPSGQPVLNQAQGARLLTKSDTTVLRETRAIYIGDAAACNVALIMKFDTAAVTFANVQPGAAYPFTITKLMSTNTTCTAVIALY